MTYMGNNSQGTIGEAKLRKKTVRQQGWPGMKRSWFRGMWFKGMWFKQKCWWNLVRLSDALTCYCFTLFRQVAKIKTKIVNSGHRSVNAEKIQISCCSIAPKVAESVQVSMMLKKWNRLPITLQKFAIIDPCNAFFLPFLCLHFDSAVNSSTPMGIPWLFNHSVILQKTFKLFPLHPSPPLLYSFPDGHLYITVSFLRS